MSKPSPDTGASTNFAGQAWLTWIKCTKFMNLLSENIADLDGIVGNGFELTRISDIPEVSSAFRKFIAPFKVSCGGEEAFEFTAISEKAYPMGVFFRFHVHLKKKGVTRMKMAIKRKPESDPPKSALERSKQAGGFPGAFEKVITLLGNPEVSCHAELRAWILDPQRWPLRFTKRNIESVGGLDFVAEELSFSRPTGESLDLTLSEKIAWFRVESDIKKLRLDLNCAETTCDLLFDTVKPIFSPDESRTAQTP